jgi:dTMP kinase
MSAVESTRPRHENALVTLARIRVVRRMWAAITFSSFGDWLGLLANTALAQHLTQHQSVSAQGAAISGVILVRLTPDLIFGPLAAALADKLDRRKTVIIGDLSAGLLYASIAIGYNLVWLYVAQFIIEAVGLFTQPAKQVIQVTIVPKRLLATANQVSLFSVYGTVPIASGVFALLSAANRLFDGSTANTTTGIDKAVVIALLLNTVTFFVSAGTVFLSRRDIPVVPADSERGQGILSLLREGVSFIRGAPLIRGLYVGIIGAFAAGGLTVGVAQLWVATLSAGTAGYSIMFGTVFTGLASGMLLGPRILPGYTRGRVFGLAIGSAGVALLIMGFVRDFILADVLAALVGAFAGMAWIIGYTLIGYEVEERLRGRIFAFVLSSVRITLLVTIAVGPVLAGALGTHAIRVGGESRLTLSGPGLTLLIGGVLALAVSYYAASRATPSRTRLRDIVRRRVMRSRIGARGEHGGLLLTVEGLDGAATAAYAALLIGAVRERGLETLVTGEPTGSAIGRRVSELLRAGKEVEPEAAALLAAADRAEHVTSVLRPALERGDVVVCDGYVLSSLAVHGAQGADMDRLRSVNSWSTGDLLPALSLVVVDVTEPVEPESARAMLIEAADADAARCVLVPAEVPDALPPAALESVRRLIDGRPGLRSAATGPRPGSIRAR